MATVFQQIASAMVASLLAAPALADGMVSKNRLRPLPAGKDAAIVVRFKSTSGQEVSLGMTDWVSDYTVECYGRAVAPADPSDAADNLLAAAWPRLAALDVVSLGAMAVVVNPQIDWEEVEADTPMACAVFRVQVAHRTALNSLAPIATSP